MPKVSQVERTILEVNIGNIIPSSIKNEVITGGGRGDLKIVERAEIKWKFEKKWMFHFKSCSKEDSGLKIFPLLQ